MCIIAIYIIFYCNNMNINVEESECLNDELMKCRAELPKLRTKQKEYKHGHTINQCSQKSSNLDAHDKNKFNDRYRYRGSFQSFL